ncbi:hypothetical protein FB451DRAFT_55698 [Mycena latifolia]|nr:hypothetical protein FB451DRAFT_55698 [Mycena latifolia]
MAELAIGLVGAAATAGGSALTTASGFTGRHENSLREEMMETRRNTADFMANCQSGDVTPDDEREFLEAREVAIQRENEYYESIESYKAASWLNPLNKFKKKEEVRRTKRLTRHSNHSLRSLNESIYSGSDASSICAFSGSPPGSNLAVHDIQDWVLEVSDNRGSSASLHSASNNSNTHAHRFPTAAASVSDFGDDADAESYAAVEAETDCELESVDDASDAGAGEGRRRYAPYAYSPSSSASVSSGGYDEQYDFMGMQTGVGAQRRPRARPSAALPVPVPVPNLTKKSRGRRVPAVASLYGGQGVGEFGHRPPVSPSSASRASRLYVCKIPGCGKCFARGEHLKRHVRSIHTYEKPHKCPYPGCGKDFSRHDNLGQHMRVHKDFVGGV